MSQQTSRETHEYLWMDFMESEDFFADTGVLSVYAPKRGSGSP